MNKPPDRSGFTGPIQCALGTRGAATHPALRAHSIWYPRTTGIWQTVWLEQVPQARIAHLRWTPNLERWEVGIEARIEQGAPHQNLRLGVKLRCGDVVVANDVYGVVAGEVQRRIARCRRPSSDPPSARHRPAISSAGYAAARDEGFAVAMQPSPAEIALAAGLAVAMLLAHSLERGVAGVERPVDVFFTMRRADEPEVPGSISGQLEHPIVLSEFGGASSTRS